MTEEELVHRWPAAFNPARRLPLALGIHDKMGIAYGDPAVGDWVLHPLYLRNCLAEGAKRIDLDGNSTSEVTFAEQERAWFLLHDLHNQIFRQRRERLHNPIRAGSCRFHRPKQRRRSDAHYLICLREEEPIGNVE